MPDLSELENNDRIKVYWGNKGWKPGTVLNNEAPLNDSTDDHIITLKYDDPTFPIIRDYLKLKWHFLAESPKYKPPKKKEKKTFKLGLTTGRKRNFPIRYVAEPTQLYQRKKRKKIPRYNKASLFSVKCDIEDTRDNGINDLEFSESQVTSPLDDTHEDILVLNATYVSSSLSPSATSTSLSSEKKNLLVETKKEEGDEEEDDVEDEVEVEVEVEEENDDEVEVEVEEEEDHEDKVEVNNIYTNQEIKEKSINFDENSTINGLREIQKCTNSILNCLNDLNIEAISSN